jgi:hypothetical protein
MFLASVLALALAPAAASADISFGPTGSGAGQLNNPNDIAVNDSTGELYVADTGNHRVSVFDEDGDFLRAFGWGVDTGAAQLEVCTTASGCQQGTSGASAGQLSNPRIIGVDNDAASPTFGDVFVFGFTNQRVDRFTSAGAFVLAFGDAVNQTTGGDVCTAVSGDVCKAGVKGFGPGQLNGFANLALDDGKAYAADCENCGGFSNASTSMRVQAFDSSSGTLINQPLTVSGQDAGRVPGFDVDSAGNFYLCTSGTKDVRKYDLGGNLVATIGSVGNSPIALAPGGNLFTVHPFDLTAGVHLFDSSGNQLSTIYGEAIRDVAGLAARSTPDGDFYLVDNFTGGGDHVAHVPIPPPGPVVLPRPPNADPVGNTSATLNASINPEGETTTYHFEYVDDATYQANGFADAHSTPDTQLNYERQQMTVSATAGQFRLSFEAETTADLAFNAGAAEVQDALRSLSSIGSPNVEVTRSVNSSGTRFYTITFTGALGSTDVPELVPSEGTTPLSGGSATVRTLFHGGPVNFHAYQEQAAITGLTPETTYHVRAVANNASGTDTGPDGTFTTREAFEFGATYATGVGTTTASLHAELNPLGTPATGHFEYVTEAEFQANGFAHASQVPDVSAGAPPLDFGSVSDAIVTRSVQLGSLQLGTAYRYRLVGESSFLSKPGPTRSLRTFPLTDPLDTGCPNQLFRTNLPSAHLPDCRAYEMVSPPEKGGGDALEEDLDVGLRLCCEGFLGTNQATPDGGKLTYSSLMRFGGPQGAPFTSQYIATRDAGDGWQTENVSAPRQTPAFLPPTANLASPTGAFTADLCTAHVFQENDRALAPGDQVGYPDAYRRRNCGTQAGAYELLTLVPPPTIEPGSGEHPPYEPRVQGSSADGQVSILRANGKLTFNASDATATNSGGTLGPAFQLYAHSGTSLRLLSVLPSPGGTTPGAAADRSSALGNFNQQVNINNFTWQSTLQNAVSEDGSRVYWEAFDGAGGSFPQNSKLYVRVNPTRAQSPVSGGQCTDPARACTYPVSEAVDPGQPEFEAATPDGSEALFSFSGGTRSGELYRYELAKAIAGEDPATLIATGMQGAILGASEDLSRVYFVSGAVLDAGAVAGQRNLYLHAEGEGHRFIAALATGIPDGLSFERQRDRKFSRVSADGSAAAFISTAALTGHDNTYSPTGQAATEVFVYDAEAGGGAGELICASCNPSGARPSAAATVVATGAFAAVVPRQPYDQHVSRPLAADGSRLFFDSYDALLPADTNGAKDVYQWQRAGSGSCEASDTNHFPPNGGCLSLVSTGTDASASAFLDASADGRDVFFSTRQRLHGADADELIDVYDARVNGGFSPPPPSAAACDLSAGACEGAPPSAPQPQGAASAVFEGPGNPPPDRCAPLAQKTRALSRQAKRLRTQARRLTRSAKRPSNPRSRAARREARRAAAAAKRRSRAARKHAARAKRCRSASR